MDKLGFTLLEMLVSLLIISVITLFVSYNAVAEVRSNQVQAGSRQVAASLEYGRSCAMASKLESKLIFKPHQIAIECSQNDRELSFDNVDITTNFPNNTATFNQRGIINQGATINVCNQSGCTRVTIGIGSSDVQIK